MERKQINNAFYNTLEEQWYEEHAHPIALLRAENAARNPWIIEKIAQYKQTPCKILDIGCGAGFLSNALAKAGHQVTGVDLSEMSLHIAKQHDLTQSVHYLQQDACALTFADHCFDVICAMDFLEHVECPEKIVKDAARLLSPGGLFFFHTFNRTLSSFLLVIKAVEWCVPNTPKNMHLYPLFIKPNELKKWCATVKLSVHELLGLKPHIHSIAFWKSLIQRTIHPDFSFKFTTSLQTGYLGMAILQEESRLKTHPCLAFQGD